MDKIFRSTGWIIALSLIVILVSLFYMGMGRIDTEFFLSYPSRFAEKAGIRSALLGSIWVMGFTALFSIPLGIASAIFLVEFAPNNKFYRFVRLNIGNLAGVPSIIYGIIGLSLFVRGLDLGRSIIAGAATLTLMALPVIILSCLEALEAVPKTLRHSARALGATKWQTARDHTLPHALSGILTGIILSLSRVAGETAPLIMMGAMTYIAFDPKGPLDSFTVLPIQIYNWSSRPQEAFQITAAAAIVVMLIGLLSLNFLAQWIKTRSTKNKSHI